MLKHNFSSLAKKILAFSLTLLLFINGLGVSLSIQSHPELFTHPKRIKESKVVHLALLRRSILFILHTQRIYSCVNKACCSSLFFPLIRMFRTLLFFKETNPIRLSVFKGEYCR